MMEIKCIKTLIVALKIPPKKYNLLVLMYNEGSTSLKHKNYVEGKKKMVAMVTRLLFISISQGKNNI
jgi:hypothetical protein